MAFISKIIQRYKREAQLDPTTVLCVCVRFWSISTNFYSTSKPVLFIILIGELKTYLLYDFRKSPVYKEQGQYLKNHKQLD